MRTSSRPSSPGTMPPLAGRRATRRVRSSPSARWIWTRSCVTRRHGSSVAITPSPSLTRCCRSLHSLAGEVARAWKSRCASTWMGDTPSAAARCGWGPSVATANLWTLPRPWTAAQNGGRPHVAWTAGRERRRPTSIHRPHFRKADRSLVKRERTDHLSTTLRIDTRNPETVDSGQATGCKRVVIIPSRALLFLLLAIAAWRPGGSTPAAAQARTKVNPHDGLTYVLRSEERRVGKECRSRWAGEA